MKSERIGNGVIGRLSDWRSKSRNEAAICFGITEVLIGDAGTLNRLVVRIEVRRGNKGQNEAKGVKGIVIIWIYIKSQKAKPSDLCAFLPKAYGQKCAIFWKMMLTMFKDWEKGPEKA